VFDSSWNTESTGARLLAIVFISFRRRQHRGWNLWDWLPGLQVACLSSLSVASIVHGVLSFKHSLILVIIPEPD